MCADASLDDFPRRPPPVSHADPDHRAVAGRVHEFFIGLDTNDVRTIDRSPNEVAANQHTAAPAYLRSLSQHQPAPKIDRARCCEPLLRQGSKIECAVLFPIVWRKNQRIAVVERVPKRRNVRISQTNRGLSCIRIGTAGYAGGEFLVVNAADDANPDSHGLPRILIFETLSPLPDHTQ